MAPNTFQATCPDGWTVVGTSFDGGGGTVWSVTDYGGYFVGGFIANDLSVATNPACVVAQCARVPAGSVGGEAKDLGASGSALEAMERNDNQQAEAKARAARG